MAPTKANATYAVTTLSLLTKVMGELPWFTSLRAITQTQASGSGTKKSTLLSLLTSAPRSAAGNVVKKL
jgi:hypothetical protein